MVYMLGSSPLARGKQPTQALRPVGEFDHYVKRTPGCPFGQSRCPRCRAILLSEWTAFLTPMCDTVSLGIIPAHAGKTGPFRVSRPGGAAHPRSRGGNDCPSAPQWWMTRLIPARAGKTPRSRDSTTRSPAHPRSRGENRLSGSVADHDAGSSPLARGKRPRFARCEGNAGLIPARAGKTVRLGVRDGRESAHPRSRGENEHALERVNEARGSSPLARGKPQIGVEGAAGVRLIPARAGKTAIVVRGVFAPGAHPRSRGENRVRRRTAGRATGSSPLARGKLEAVRAYYNPARLIPARAGKTPFVVAHGFLLRAHPRSRGENRSGCPGPLGSGGSSPLARGKLYEPQRAPPFPRLIPARAGKTVRMRARVLRVQAHPRSRGENGFFAFVGAWRVWLIPARAGKTWHS